MVRVEKFLIKIIMSVLLASMVMELLSLFLLKSNIRKKQLKIKLPKQDGFLGQPLLKCLPHFLKMQVLLIRLIWQVPYLEKQS